MAPIIMIFYFFPNSKVLQFRSKQKSEESFLKTPQKYVGMKNMK